MSSSTRKHKREQLKFQVDLFESLDEMWLHNWQELTRTNNLKWLIKDNSKIGMWVDPTKLDERFLLLMDEWFELTDQDSNRAELYVIMKKLIAVRNRVINGERFAMNDVNKFERLLAALTHDNSGVDHDKQRMQVSIKIKMQIDKRTITVKDYIKLIDAVIEMDAAAKNNLNGGE